MVEGTFANIRLVNKLASVAGPITKHIPSGREMPVYDAAEVGRTRHAAVETQKMEWHTLERDNLCLISCWLLLHSAIQRNTHPAHYHRRSVVCCASVQT